MSAPQDRADVAGAAADHLEALGPEGLAGVGALVGFDGFIDRIIRVVDTRRSMEREDFDAIGTITGFAERIGAAAGKSTNIEFALEESRYGGNGPLMGGGLGRLGVSVDFIGALGANAQDVSVVHPVFEPFVERCRTVVSVARPAVTHACEFDDGKIMLCTPDAVQAVTWERLLEAVGLESLRERVRRATLIGIVNWTQMGGVDGILDGLTRDVLPAVPSPREKRVFVDLSDPAKRSEGDIRAMLGRLRAMDEVVPVALGLNHAEALRIARATGVDAFGAVPSAEDTHEDRGEVFRVASVRLRDALGLEAVTVHPREGAAAATRDGQSEWFDGPFTASPALSTGAGDHYNAGFALGLALRLPLRECLAVGCAVSGAYVRDAISPDLTRLCAFLRALPGPQLG